MDQRAKAFPSPHSIQTTIREYSIHSHDLSPLENAALSWVPPPYFSIYVRLAVHPWSKAFWTFINEICLFIVYFELVKNMLDNRYAFTVYICIVGTLRWKRWRCSNVSCLYTLCKVLRIPSTACSKKGFLFNRESAESLPFSARKKSRFSSQMFWPTDCKCFSKAWFVLAVVHFFLASQNCRP